MKLRAFVRRIPPAVATVLLSLILLAVQVCLDWSISRLNPNLQVWSLKNELLSSLSEIMLIAGLFYTVQVQLTKRERDVAILNHELRNALEVIISVIYIAKVSGVAKEQAQGAMNRISRTLREISTD